MDPVTGEVRAMVGGRNFDESHFNRAVQAHRQPGSAFKPFVYAAAIENGYSPASVVDHLDDPIQTLQGAWVPEDEHSTADEMTLRTALRTSSNRAAVRLLQQVGIERTVGYAKQLGIGSLPNVPSLALGSGEVTLLSMTAAYSAFANHGDLPIAVRDQARRGRRRQRAVRSGAREPPRAERYDGVPHEQHARRRDQLRYRPTEAGPWALRSRPRARRERRTISWTPGSSGFTPTLATGVWVGFDQPQSILRNGFAGDIAVPLWAKYMKDATKGDKARVADGAQGCHRRSMSAVSRASCPMRDVMPSMSSMTMAASRRAP